METSNIKIYADYQRLTVRSGVMRYASDTVNYVHAEFEFGKGWEDFDAVQAIWKSRYDTISVVLDENGCCMVPQEVLARRSRVQVNIVGFTVDEESLTARLTSYPALVLDVDAKAELSGEETAEITPSQFEQYVGMVSASATSASESASAASASAEQATESATSAAASEASAANSMVAASSSELAAAESALSASGSADLANASAVAADESAESASASAQSASSDADRAETARAFLEGVSAEATTLAPGSQATASYDDGVFSFGIPQGLQGIQGERGPQGIQGVKGETGDRGLTGDTGNGIASAVLNSDYTLTLTFTDGTTYTTPSIRGAQGDAFEYEDFTPAQLEALTGPQGETGNGIASASMESYKLVLHFTDGTTYTSPSIRGAKGSTGARGATGATGNGIASIAKTSTEGLVDTYTITFTNGTTTTFNVTNGREAYTAGTGIDITNGVISIDLDNAEGSNY